MQLSPFIHFSILKKIKINLILNIYFIKNTKSVNPETPKKKFNYNGNNLININEEKKNTKEIVISENICDI